MARAAKPRTCSRCKGTGKQGKQLCKACNPSGAIGDRVVGAAQRWSDRASGNSVRVTTAGITETRRGRQSTRVDIDSLPPGHLAANRARCSCGATDWLHHSPRGKTTCLPGHGCKT